MTIAGRDWIIMKFGGTSVSSLERWLTIMEQCAQHRAEGFAPLLVCSAISGVSNLLETAVDLAPHNKYQDALSAIETKHRALAKALEISYEQVCLPLLDDLRRILVGSAMLEEVSMRQRARVLSVGELLSTRMGCAFLTSRGMSAKWMDARDLLVAISEPHLPEERRILSAVCEYQPNSEFKSAMENIKEEVVITQGFIARDESGRTVLLGRGGSDTSAAYLAAKIGAKRCEIWTDVPGMFTANPRKIPEARLLNALTYAEAQEIASTGAKVLHPRCIVPARNHNIPLHIRCSLDPSLPKTVISSKTTASGPQVKAVSARLGVTLISMETIGMWQQVGFLADIFAVFKSHGLSVDLVSTSETNVTASLDAGSVHADSATIGRLIEDLNRYCRANVIGPCAAVSVVGNQIRGLLHKLGPALKVFEEQAIHLVSQAASDLNLTFVVDEGQAERLVGRLHELLIANAGPASVMGPTWAELFGNAQTQTTEGLPGRWWKDRIEELQKIAQDGPVYAYHLPTVRKRASDLLSLVPVDRVFYAMKANSNPEILAALFDLGVGFECVSPGEIQRVRESCPEIRGERILFTPNFAGPEEYAEAFEGGVYVTLDNLHPLEAWPEIFREREVIVRIDPGEGRGHHEYVRTAGTRSKFGISPTELPKLKALASRHGVRIVGFHAHAGSGIRTPENWSHIGMLLGQLAESFPDVAHIDVGGGLGVVEKPGEAPLNLGGLSVALQSVKDAFPNLELWMEPGRYLVAESGVLLTRVSQLKQKGPVHYVGINAGMNALMRPALYGAWHDIVNISKFGDPVALVANVVGPICESGDTLGYRRKLPQTEEGDVLLIDVTGAYGFTMSSEYNLRPRPQELTLES